ncbi:MAG: ferrous iron transport protein B [Gammaproteobacteria bacterium]|nr:ferrous iron transport protein B [Gammaproteobacteria bacterium]NVK87633.1 ferrous iron transport protein B [Gammaproteobacteria bacterium]
MNIALVGNPNSGKTTIFNRLTGSRQKVGNWPGVTVEKKTGSIKLSNSTTVNLIDLPGVYNLDQVDPGKDEQIAAQYLLAREADLIINIIDAANLSRNLILTSQLKELQTPMIVVLNMSDVALDRGLEINAEVLAERLQVPVVSMIGATGSGLDALLHEIRLCEQAFDDSQEVQREAAATCSFGGETDQIVGRSTKRYQMVKALTDGVVRVIPGRSDRTESIDRYVLNRWLGVPIFLFMMYLMFTIAVNLGAVFIDFFDILFGAFLVDGVAVLSQQLGLPQWLEVILANGLGGGIQLVATFIPVIGVLYLCLSILEDSGYLSRAAFVIDRLMAKIGLPGNAFVPLIVGFGCNVPAVMAARTMNRESDRLLTIVMAPFMSCGARLTVYALFAAAFFPSNGANVVFALYLMGIVVAIFSGWLFRKQVFAAKAAPSFIEMPAYHLPVWRNIFLTTWHRLKNFLSRAGKTIVMVVVLLSFLNSIGTDGSFGNENSKNSVLSKIGQTITPVFAPLGIKEENWPATVGIFTGLFAKEAIVGTLDALYQESEQAETELDLWQSTQDALQSIPDNFSGLVDSLADPLGLSSVADAETVTAEQELQQQTLTQMASLFDGQLGAFAYLVLILLYTPCVAVLGAIKREAGALWMWTVIAWTSYLAYSLATSIYQIANFSAQPLFASLWLIGMALGWLVFVFYLKHIGRKMNASDVYLVNLS